MLQLLAILGSKIPFEELPRRQRTLILLEHVHGHAMDLGDSGSTDSVSGRTQPHQQQRTLGGIKRVQQLKSFQLAIREAVRCCSTASLHPTCLRIQNASQ